MFHKDGNWRRTWKGRAFSLFLSAVLLLGSVPGFVLPASAHWADPYLDTLVDWGAMRADQIADPDTPLTRAEFMAIINRAYGYQEMGEMPFTDVLESDWFYDDVAIAYNAGYMKGTSATTASPNARLTREQAVCILGRNMMLKETPGEDLGFADSRSISGWARGMVKTAVNNYIVTGYPDDTFRPKNDITKGQMAVLVTQCVGTPVKQSGAYELGDVSGNLTITAPNVTLRNTTISGDLYVSGGVGLGGIKLENVNVLGRIVVSGTGESEAGFASVTMRNVTANEMLVDNMRGKTVTVRADGITEIPKTIVRTSAYLEDNNTDDKGLMSIELDGGSGSRLTLAGRIKEVTDKTPNSAIQVAKGTVAKLTVDEAAVNASVLLDRNTSVKEMNLDVGANVTGDGDIDQLRVNAPGCVVSMLPDKIYIRPGLTANIAGIVMDHQAAEEGSLDPRLLSGYPAARDITPTGLRADFAGNKKGTVYWAVSSITDGSIGEDNLISPPSYGSKAIRNGSVALATGGSEVSAQITGLAVGGSYYLSAILVDDLGNRSPVKVTAFSTPDNTVPAFGQGYPYMSFVGKANEYDNAVTAQVAVMATKTCRMYYAVLPAGAAAPTPDELRSASVTSNLGYGVVEMEKNYVWDGDRAIIVSRRLDQQKNYVLYLWLTDGVNSSAVTSLAFSTPDVTPPEFVAFPKVNGDAQANTVPMTATINENGTIYWVAVKSGADYPLPNPSNENENTEGNKTARLDSEYAKIQVANGMNAVSSGRVNATANTPVANLNITGLQAETSYDVYFLIRDTAGNDARSVHKMENVRTLDTGNPTVRQSFTSVDSQDPTRPRRDTSIVLEFSESVVLNGRDLLSLYRDTQNGTASENEAALDTFTSALRDNIVLEFLRNSEWHSGVKGSAGVSENEWVVDFSKAKVSNDNGRIKLTFPGGADSLRLKNGGIYRFRLVPSPDEHPIRDQSQFALRDPNAPSIEDKYKAVEIILDEFTVVFAQVNLFSSSLNSTEWPTAIEEENDKNQDAGVDIGTYKVNCSFRMSAKDIESVADNISYDLLMWSDSRIEYDLYYRVVAEKDGVQRAITAQPGFGMPNMPENPDPNGWVKLGNSGRHSPIGTQISGMAGKSLHCTFNGLANKTLPQLNSLRGKMEDGAEVFYDFAISVRKMKDTTNPKDWDGTGNIYVDVAAGDSVNLIALGEKGIGEGSIVRKAWNDFRTLGLSGGGGESVGSVAKKEEQGEDARELKLGLRFAATTPPDFIDVYPDFETSETAVKMYLQLNRSGDIYYMIGCASRPVDKDDSIPEDNTPEDQWRPTLSTQVDNVNIHPSQVPTSGAYRQTDFEMPVLTSPNRYTVMGNETTAGTPIKWDMEPYSPPDTRTVTVDGLTANTTYYVYFVTTVPGGRDPSEVQIYKFKTTGKERPELEIEMVAESGDPGTVGVHTINDNPDFKGALLSYRTYPVEIAKNDSTWMGTTTLDDDLDNDDITDKELPAAYKDLSIYDALKTRYDYAKASKQGTDGYLPNITSTKYSVFDIYATDTAKTNMLNWIKRQSGSPAPTDRQADQERANGEFLWNIAKLDPTNTYFILAAGVNNSENADNQKKAKYYSFIGEEVTPGLTGTPTLVGARGEFTVNESDNTKLNSGWIRLTFQPALYITAEDPTDPNKTVQVKLEKEHLKKVFMPSSGIDFDSDDTYVSSNDDYQTTINLKFKEDGTVSTTLSINSRTFSGPDEVNKGPTALEELVIQRNPDVWPKQDTGQYELRVSWALPGVAYEDAKYKEIISGTGPVKPDPVKPDPDTTSVPGASGARTSFTVSSADTVNGTSQISFNAPLYAGEDTPVTSVKQLSEIADEIKGIDLSQSRIVTSGDGTTLILKLKGKAEDVSLKISSGKLTNSAGEAAKEALSIQVEKRLPPDGNDANMGIKNFYTDVSWGDQTWTDKGTNK